MKRLKNIIVAYSLLIFGGYTSLSQAKKGIKSKEDQVARKFKQKRLSRAEILRRKMRGEKIYKWGELEVWARNEKNAVRKFQNIVDQNQSLKMKLIKDASKRAN